MQRRRTFISTPCLYLSLPYLSITIFPPPPPLSLSLSISLYSRLNHFLSRMDATLCQPEVFSSSPSLQAFVGFKFTKLRPTSLTTHSRASEQVPPRFKAILGFRGLVSRRPGERCGPFFVFFARQCTIIWNAELCGYSMRRSERDQTGDTPQRLATSGDSGHGSSRQRQKVTAISGNAQFRRCGRIRRLQERLGRGLRLLQDRRDLLP
jgi:hypothetical protein